MSSPGSASGSYGGGEGARLRGRGVELDALDLRCLEVDLSGTFSSSPLLDARRFLALFELPS